MSTPMNLPETRDTRFYREPFLCPFAITGQLTWMDHTWSDQGHLPNEYVEELWQFIKACPAKKPADASNTWVTFELHILLVFLQKLRMFCQVFICVRDHCPELQSIEAATMPPNDLSKMEYLAPVVELDTNHDHQKDWHQYQNAYGREYDISNTLQNTVEKRRLVNN